MSMTMLPKPHLDSIYNKSRVDYEESLRGLSAAVDDLTQDEIEKNLAKALVHYDNATCKHDIQLGVYTELSFVELPEVLKVFNKLGEIMAKGYMRTFRPVKLAHINRYINKYWTARLGEIDIEKTAEYLCDCKALQYYYYPAVKGGLVFVPIKAAEEYMEPAASSIYDYIDDKELQGPNISMNHLILMQPE